MGKTISVIIAVVIIVVGFILALNFGVIPKKEYGPYDSFVICLKASGAKFYGDYADANTLKQMSLFGDSLYVLEKSGVYIECNRYGANPKIADCKEANLKVYPTWIIDNKKYDGIQGFNKLEEVTSCER